MELLNDLFMKKPTPPPGLLGRGTFMNLKPLGVISLRRDGVSQFRIGVSVRPRISIDDDAMKSVTTLCLFLMERQLVKPKLTGPGLKAISPDIKRSRVS